MERRPLLLQRGAQKSVPRVASGRGKGKGEHTHYVSSGVVCSLSSCVTTTEVSAVEEVKKEVKRMSAVSRKQVLDYLLLLAQTPAGDKDRSVLMWRDSVARSLRKRLPGSVADFPPKVLVTESNASVKKVEDFLHSVTPVTLSTPERKAVYDLLADLLADRAYEIAQRASIPLSLKLILSTADQLHGVFDSAFPGYLQAGMGIRVILKLTAPV